MARYKFIGNPNYVPYQYGFSKGGVYSEDYNNNNSKLKPVRELIKFIPNYFELITLESSLNDIKEQTPLSRTSPTVLNLVEKHNELEKEISLRYNSGKPRWSLIHYPSLLPLVKVLEHGCIKYSRDNWKKGLDKKELLESTMRHLVELMEDNEDDSESKLAHTGHIMANIMFYEYHKNNNSFTQGK